MSKVCKECGHQLDDNVQICPNCGCPAENASTSAFMDKDVLNQCKSTDAEAIVSDIAQNVLTWCKILSWFSLVFIVIGGIATAGSVGGSAWYLLPIYIAIGFIAFMLWCILGKIIWGVIMLFVNMSTTLKRIEIKLEENGTR